MNQRDDIEYRKAAAKYSVSYMSNAKWLKLFRTLIDSGIVIEFARWKFIDTEHTIEVSFPSKADLQPTRFADGKFQPVEYRWLESVSIPHTFRPMTGVGYMKKQDTEALVSALEKVGQFPLEVSADGVTIRAYRI